MIATRAPQIRFDEDGTLYVHGAEKWARTGLWLSIGGSTMAASALCGPCADIDSCLQGLLSIAKGSFAVATASTAKHSGRSTIT